MVSRFTKWAKTVHNCPRKLCITANLGTCSRSSGEDRSEYRVGCGYLRTDRYGRGGNRHGCDPGFYFGRPGGGPDGATYAELSTHLPFSSVFTQQAFASRTLTVVVGLAVILTGIVSAATMSWGFAGYLQVLLPTPELVAIPFCRRKK